MKLDKKSLIRIAAVAFALFLAVHYWDAFVALLKSLVGVAAPLIIGAVIAYVVSIPMGLFEKIYFPKSNKKAVLKTRTPVCMILAFLSIIAIISAVALLVIPQLTSCVILLAEVLPAEITKLTEKVHSLGILPEDIFEFLKTVDWKSLISSVSNTLSSGITNMMGFLISTVTGVFNVIVTSLLSVIFSVYLLAGKKMLRVQARRTVRHFIKPSVFKKLHYLLTVLDECFRKFIIGQSTEALILGLLTTLGMLVFGFPYPTMVGALVGFTALIPVVGAFIGAGVGAFMILTVSPLKALLFLVFIIVLQQIEGNVIYPRVVGSSIGLPGLWVLAAVTIGGGLFGVVGMLVGVPFTAALYRLLGEELKKPPKTKKCENE